MGAVADWRSASPLASRLAGLGEGRALDEMAKSVSSFRAVDGARTWYLGSEGSVMPVPNERFEFARLAAALRGAGGRAVVVVVVVVAGASVVWVGSSQSATALSVGQLEDAGAVECESDSGPSMVLYRCGGSVARRSSSSRQSAVCRLRVMLNMDVGLSRCP